jgi:hypothetical protein
LLAVLVKEKESVCVVTRLVGLFPNIFNEQLVDSRDAEPTGTEGLLYTKVLVGSTKFTI